MSEVKGQHEAKCRLQAGHRAGGRGFEVSGRTRRCPQGAHSLVTKAAL